MKFITLLFFFVATQQAFAAKCSPEMQQIQFNRHGYVELRTTNTGTGFSAFEQKMIHKVVTLQDFLSTNTQEQSQQDFGGDSNGEITYFKVGRKTIARVHYWPGDNEYGAYVEVVGSKILIQATISDGDLYCY